MGRFIGYNPERGFNQSSVPIVSEEKIFKHFQKESYVKTMSTYDGGLGWWEFSSDTILKGDHSRNIPSKFGPNWPNYFKGWFLNIFLIGSYVKPTWADVSGLGWQVGHRIQSWKGTTKRPFPQCLVPTGQVVSEKIVKPIFLILSQGGYLSSRVRLSDSIMKVDHPRIIPAKFSPDWPRGFKRED